MSHALDMILVGVVVLLAAGYLVWRKAASVRRATRDWTTGRSKNCGSCPVLKIRDARHGPPAE